MLAEDMPELLQWTQNGPVVPKFTLKAHRSNQKSSHRHCILIVLNFQSLKFYRKS